MEKRKDLFWNIVFKYALIATLVMAAVRYLISVSGNNFYQFRTIIFIVLTAAIHLGVKKYRDQELEGVIPFKKALRAGFFISMICAVFYSFYVYFELSVFVPQNYEVLLRVNEALINNGTFPQFGIFATASSVEEQVKLMRGLFTPATYAFSEILAVTFWGTMIALLISSLMRKSQVDTD